MVKIAMTGLAVVVAVAGCLTYSAGLAQARPAFKKQFDTKYMKDKSSALVKAWKRSSCNACHIGGIKDRKNRNSFGEALAKLLNKKDSDALSFKNRRKNPAAAEAAAKKVQDAFTTVEKLPSDPKDKTSATFGALIKTGKLKMSPKTLPKK